MLDPTSIGTIVSIAFLSISEILALTPLTQNGIIHAFINLVQKYVRPIPV